jgi:hypothetical protein
VNQLKGMKKERATQDQLSHYIHIEFETNKLLQLIAPIENCKIDVFKPRKQSLIEQKIEYISWDKAASWSDGEKYAAYMTMFMVLITHMRKRILAKDQSWKVIIADNPFGRASSDHVMEPIIKLANEAKIQLFFLTAIRDEGIRKQKHFTQSENLLIEPAPGGIPNPHSKPMLSITVTFVVICNHSHKFAKLSTSEITIDASHISAFGDTADTIDGGQDRSTVIEYRVTFFRPFPNGIEKQKCLRFNFLSAPHVPERTLH